MQICSTEKCLNLKIMSSEILAVTESLQPSAISTLMSRMLITVTNNKSPSPREFRTRQMATWSVGQKSVLGRCYEAAAPQKRCGGLISPLTLRVRPSS